MAVTEIQQYWSLCDMCEIKNGSYRNSARSEFMCYVLKAICRMLAGHM